KPLCSGAFLSGVQIFGCSREWIIDVHTTTAIDERQRMTTGLYRLDEFKDNCGFGLIAHLKGKASHRLLETAIESLTCMTHRGGIAADGKTGDGCGLLLQKPDSFLRAVAKDDCGIELGANYGVGAIMLSRHVERAERAREIFTQAIGDQ